MPGQPSPNRLSRAALGLAAILLSAVMAELALRLVPAGMVVEADLYRMSEGLLLLRPGLTRRHVTPQWEVTLRIDSRGFRDFERQPRESDTVVLGLGDSQAFGWGVELEETFYSRGEAALAPPVRLVKAAVPGTGTSDQARLLERLAPAYRPRAVIVALFVGNDFVDVARGGSAQYEVVGGLLAHRGEAATGPGALTRLAIRSRLLQLLRAVQFRLGFAPEKQRRWDDWMREYAQVHLRNPPAETRDAYQATLSALDGLDDYCRRSGAKLLLVVLPRSFQVDPAELDEMLRRLGWSHDELDLDRPQRILADWAAARGAAYADALPAFRRHTQEGREPLFYTPDAHMTPAGHVAAAAVVEPALKELLLGLPPG